MKQIQNVATNLIHGSLAKSSKESYRRVFAFNKEFMLLYFPLEIVFPASLEHLTLFIAYCFQKNIASSTVLTYMSAISFLLQLGGYEDLTGHFIISKALRGYHKEKAAKDSRLPITPSILKGLCQSLPKTCSSRKFAGLNVKNYKSHSFRIGAATTAWAKGFSEEQIQQMGRWNSEAFKKYIRIPLLSLQ